MCIDIPARFAVLLIELMKASCLASSIFEKRRMAFSKAGGISPSSGRAWPRPIVFGFCPLASARSRRMAASVTPRDRAS